MVQLTNGISASPFHLHYSLHPRLYRAPYAETPITIDGNPDKEPWSSIPWSYDFDDIQDPSSDASPGKECSTQMKMAWDKDYLYIIAVLHSDFEVRATFTERNSPIFQQDSDFEVFLDPLGSCHFYKELELNALNTVWNLMLDKPYWDGGSEHSGRIAKPGEEAYFEVQGQKTAVKMLRGRINQRGMQRASWAVEVALSHKDTQQYLPFLSAPKIGDRWRINFSRVEKKGDINWTWMQQRVWDPVVSKFLGKIDMHLPDAWGYVEFSPSTEDSAKIGEVPCQELMNGAGDPSWPARLAAMNVYYAQKKYNEDHHEYANDILTLGDLVNKEILSPFAVELNTFNKKEYDVKIIDAGGWTAIVNQERLLLVRESAVKAVY